MQKETKQQERLVLNKKVNKLLKGFQYFKDGVMQLRSKITKYLLSVAGST